MEQAHLGKERADECCASLQISEHGNLRELRGSRRLQPHPPWRLHAVQLDESDATDKARQERSARIATFLRTHFPRWSWLMRATITLRLRPSFARRCAGKFWTA
eukprot:scaffold137378_cov27-Tisochrysis_lutea.AAC.2